MSRTEKFLARIEAHLATLPSDTARRAFLSKQIAAWEARYDRFVATGGKSEPVTDPSEPPTAFDFSETITALHARKVAIRLKLVQRVASLPCG